MGAGCQEEIAGSPETQGGDAGLGGGGGGVSLYGPGGLSWEAEGQVQG